VASERWRIALNSAGCAIRYSASGNTADELLLLDLRRWDDCPVGVRGRYSDNSRVRQVLDWAPRISLEDGLRRTYAWIEDHVRADLQDPKRSQIDARRGVTCTG
jgi:hypothetical protein